MTGLMNIIRNTSLARRNFISQGFIKNPFQRAYLQANYARKLFSTNGNAGQQDPLSAFKETKISFPKSGIRLSLLDKLIEEWGGRKALENLSTRQICESFLLPVTKSSNLSYCELIQKLYPSNSFIQPANVYVSHAWDGNFINLVDTIKGQFGGNINADIYLWLDIFSVNQHYFHHQTQSLIPLTSLWLEELEKSLATQFQAFLFILDSKSIHSSLLPFSRTWCLYELYCASKAKTHIVFAVNNIPHYFSLVMTPTIFQSQSIENSQTYSSDDKQLILTHLQTSLTFNHHSLSQMNDHLTKVIHDVLTRDFETLFRSTETGSFDNYQISLALANIYRSSKQNTKAITTLEKGLSFVRQFKNTPQQGILSSHLHNLAVNQRDAGLTDAAISSYQEYIQLVQEISSSATVSNNHRQQYEELIYAYHSLGLCLLQKQVYHQAEYYLKLALQELTLFMASIPATPSGSNQQQLHSNHSNHVILKFKILNDLVTLYELTQNTTQSELYLEKYFLLYKEKTNLLDSKKMLMNLKENKNNNQHGIPLEMTAIIKKLAIFYQLNKKFSQAEQLLLEYIPIVRETLSNMNQSSTSSPSSSSSHQTKDAAAMKEEFISILYSLVLVYKNVNQLEKSLPFMEEYLTLMKTLPTSTDASIQKKLQEDKLAIVYNIANLYGQKPDKITQLENLCLEYHQEILSVYGRNSPMNYFFLLILSSLQMKRIRAVVQATSNQSPATNQQQQQQQQQQVINPEIMKQAELFTTQCYEIQSQLPANQRNEPMYFNHLQDLILLNKQKKPFQQELILPWMEILLKEYITKDVQLQERKQTSLPIRSFSDDTIFEKIFELILEMNTLEWQSQLYEKVTKRFEMLLQSIEQREKLLLSSSSSPTTSGGPAAMQLFEKELQKRQKNYQKMKLKIYSGLALLELDQSHYMIGDALLMDNLKRSLQFFGENHVETLMILTHIANSLFQQKNYVESMKLYEETWMKYLKYYPQEINHISMILMKLMNYYSSLFLTSERDRILLETFHKFREVHGENHIATKQIEEVMKAFRKK